jgi:hypothetical protein
MATLERVMDLRGQGYSETQIIDTLKQEGVSPKDIYNALTQSSIKTELSQTPMTTETEEVTPEAYSQSVDNTTDQTQYFPETGQQEYGEPQQEYQQYQQYQTPQPATDIETINEIAEQIVEEKTNEIKKQMSSFKNSNEEMKSDLERMSKKLEKLENNFNELQVAILRRIGEYGDNIKNISNEMHETQGSFSKILNPLTDNIRELQKLTGSFDKQKTQTKQMQETPAEVNKEPETPTPEEPRKTQTKPEPGFEDYLR